MVQRGGRRATKDSKGKFVNANHETVDFSGEKDTPVSGMNSKPTFKPGFKPTKQSKNDLGKRLAENVAGGSRFSALNMNEEDCIDLNESGSSCDKAGNQSQAFNGVNKKVVEGKAVKSTAASIVIDEVRLNVSHGSLANSLKTLGCPGKETRVEVVISGVKKARVLKDITNKSNFKPAKPVEGVGWAQYFFPAWKGGAKFQLGQARDSVREVRQFCFWM